VPKASPTFSALGALAAAPSIDEERSYLYPLQDADLERLRELWEELDRRAEGYFTRAGFPRSALCARYQLNLRYPGQNWSLAVDVAEVKGPQDLGFVTAEMLSRAAERFHQRHENEYGHRREAEAPEVTGVRLATSCETPRPRFGSGLTAPRRTAEPSHTRRANLGAGFQETPIYRGPDLQPGHEVLGPAVIEESFTTIAVYPGWSCLLDDAGDYLLQRLPV